MRLVNVAQGDTFGARDRQTILEIRPPHSPAAYETHSDAVIGADGYAWRKLRFAGFAAARAAPAPAVRPADVFKKWRRLEELMLISLTREGSKARRLDQGNGVRPEEAATN